MIWQKRLTVKNIKLACHMGFPYYAHNSVKLCGFLFLLMLAAVFPAAAQEIDGELVLRSYLHTFPEKAAMVDNSGGDWFIKLGNDVYYWAGGRLLPPSLLGEKDSWAPHDFSAYPAEIPTPAEYSREDIERIRRESSAEARLAQDNRHYGFFMALYGAATEREAEGLLKGIRFLGRQIRVNNAIAASLERIDSNINRLAAADSALKNFLDSIGSAQCYAWREIRLKRQMSYHSWGMALDILPKVQGSRAIYWLWEQNRNDAWMMIPAEQRWQPHQAFIRAFENEGFVWGGKWELYDNMHFEFRPELHEMNRLLAAQNSPAPGARAAVGQDLHHLAPVW